MQSPATATAPSTTVRAPRPKDDVQPVAHETADRIATGLVTALPILALGLVGWQLWGAALNRIDVPILSTV
jgi:stearoyl-CoA desaturase (delta-9 desaturase)